jgi:hypothetical protein
MVSLHSPKDSYTLIAELALDAQPNLAPFWANGTKKLHV